MSEVRQLKVIFTKSGSGSVMNRITLPTVWIREMGLTEDDKNVTVTFDNINNKIIIEKENQNNE